jgi:hypothetical protein
MQSKSDLPPNSPNNAVLLNKAEVIATVAMSDLFLFNGPLEDDFKRIAEKLRMTRLTGTELESLFRNDVAFLLYRNQLMVNGTWGAFDEAWLIAEINKRRTLRNTSTWIRILDTIRAGIRSKSYNDYWQRVRKEMDQQNRSDS